MLILKDEFNARAYHGGPKHFIPAEPLSEMPCEIGKLNLL